MLQFLGCFIVFNYTVIEIFSLSKTKCNKAVTPRIALISSNFKDMGLLTYKTIIDLLSDGFYQNFHIKIIFLGQIF